MDGAADRFKSRFSEYRWLRRRSRVAGFADACCELFEQVKLEPGDHVYCSTVSDMDLLGLVRYLNNHPESEKASWHLQFHFGVFSGRDPQYGKQERNVRRLRQRFATAMADLSRHNFSFYTTTDELRRQFNRLETAEFQTLPWPVSQRFHSRPRENSQPPLRLVCAGGVRREKGGELVGPLIRALDDEFLKSKKVQLLIQTGSKRKSRTMLGLESAVAEIEEFSNELPESSVVALPHPLPPSAYADLIRSADIGLLLYDSDEYFARCSGILVELLAAGVPVIGPAGCWLGNQIEQANQEYLNRVLGNSVIVSEWDLASRTANVSGKPHNRDTSELALVATGPDLLVRLALSPSAACGQFARVNLEQFAIDGSKTAELTTITPATAEKGLDGSLISTLFPIHSDTSRIRITTENAYDAAPPPVRQHHAVLINAAGAPRHQPMGRIGLTMSSPEFIPLLLRDVVENYEHYRASAEGFSIQWRTKHAPARTIEKLTSTKGIPIVALRPAS